MAETAPTVPRTLHAHQFLVAEYGGALLPRLDAESITSRCLPRCRGVNHGDWGLHRPSQRESQALHLDCQSERHPGKSEARPQIPEYCSICLTHYTRERTRPNGKLASTDFRKYCRV